MAQSLEDVVTGTSTTSTKVLVAPKSTTIKGTLEAVAPHSTNANTTVLTINGKVYMTASFNVANNVNVGDIVTAVVEHHVAGETGYCAKGTTEMVAHTKTNDTLTRVTTDMEATSISKAKSKAFGKLLGYAEAVGTMSDDTIKKLALLGIK